MKAQFHLIILMLMLLTVNLDMGQGRTINQEWSDRFNMDMGPDFDSDSDPDFNKDIQQYPLTSNTYENDKHRRGPMPSLSITNPIDILRRRMFVEMARRKVRESEKQAQLNRQMLNFIGKR